MENFDYYFEGYLVDKWGSLTVWQDGPRFMVSHQLPTFIRQWHLREYIAARRLSAEVRAAPPPVTKPMGEERYPREYPLNIDWTRI